jgi:hypothetical protein
MNHLGRSRYPINRVISQRMTSANINGRNARNRSRGSGGAVSRFGSGEKKEKYATDEGKYVNDEEAELYSAAKPGARIVPSNQKSRSRESDSEDCTGSTSLLYKEKVIISATGGKSNDSSLSTVGEVSVMPTNNEGCAEKIIEKSILDEVAMQTSSTAISTPFILKTEDSLENKTANEEAKFSFKMDIGFFNNSGTLISSSLKFFTFSYIGPGVVTCL